MERQTFPEVPPRVEFALTDKGRALVPLIEDMRAYGLKWLGVDCAADEADSEAAAETEVAPDREPAIAAV